MAKIVLKLKKVVIDSKRYEEFIWIRGKCYSIFKDSERLYTVAIDCQNVETKIPTKKRAIARLKEEILK